MKKFEYILGIAAIALSLAACTKTGQNYEPNPPYPGDNVFFPQDLNTKIELEKGATFFQVPLLRSANIDKATAITIEATGPAIDGGYVLAPTGAVFEENKDTSLVCFLVDAEKLGLNNEVTFTVAITDPAAVTPYGESSVTFKVSIPLPWLKFGAGGTFYEAPDFWGEEEQKQIEYQEISDKIWFCKIPQCFGKNTIADGDEYDCQDYTFYWNKETDILYPVSAYMGYTNEKGPYVFGTEAEWILFSNEIDPGTPGTEGWFSLIDKARSVAAASGYSYVPYYDGNGIFYLCDCYFVDLKVNPNGSGYWDITPDMFVDDAFAHADYSCDIEYSGMFVTPKGVATPVLNFTGGADVKGIKYVLTADDKADYNAVVASIVDGTADNVVDVLLSNGKGTDKPEIDPGVWFAIAVPYGEDDVLHGDYAVQIKFNFKGLNPSPAVENLVAGYYSYVCTNQNEGVLSLTAVDATHYTVSGLAISNGLEWNAVYDKAAGTLTCDGTVKGNEERGNLFNAILGFFDAGKTQVYTVESWGEKGNDPIVFDVDTSTGELTAIHPEVYASVYNLASGQYLGDYNAVQDGAEVAFLTSATTTVSLARATSKQSAKSMLLHSGDVKAHRHSSVKNMTPVFGYWNGLCINNVSFGKKDFSIFIK